jgi:exodeoxyribonuclease V alpha subunit
VTVAAERRWPPEWAPGLAGGDVDAGALHLALEAARWPQALAAAERRAFALLVLASCDARAEGATRLDLGAGLDGRLGRLGAGAADRAAVAGLAARLDAHPALAPLVGRPGDHRPFIVERIVDRRWLYQERDLRLELRLADALGARLEAPLLRRGDPAAALAAAAGQRGDRRWTAAQSAAIAAAIERPLTVVTGGPGSGKTALIGGIVRAWRALGMSAEEIAVAAPTGKAANRVAEALAADGPEIPAPGTLHRLLGFSARRSLRGGAFRHHENNRLPQTGVIVDEASMVDLALAEQLVRALRPDAHLVLIGDADQLPAIQAGSVFRDLGAVALDLPESHRMSPDDPAGAEILTAARAIAAGRAPAPRRPGSGAEGLAALGFAGFEWVEPDGRDASGRRLVAAFLDRWQALHLGPDPARDPRAVLSLAGGGLDPDGEGLARALLDRGLRARLMTVTRVGPAGADRINALLARRIAEALGEAGGGELPPGTPVMMVENDYDRGLMNGDQGVILRVRSRPGAPATEMAAFPRGDRDGRGGPGAKDGKLALYPAATLRGLLEVAYATTVHKAQGSEVVHGALILPELDLPLVSRELIYTAVTRARRSMVVVGRRDLVEAAVARPLGRSSGLGERLAARGALRSSGPAADRTIDER